MGRNHHLFLSAVWFVLGRLLLKVGAYGKAATALGNAQQCASYSIASYWKGWAEFKQGKLDAALREYTRYALSDDVDERFAAAALAMVGHIHGIERHYDLSLTFYERALRVRPERQYLLGAGMAAFELNSLPKAKDYFTRALKANASDYEVIRAVARVDLGLGNYSEAEGLIKQCIGHDPNDADMYVMLGALHDEKREYRKAIEALHQAVRLRPHDTNALVGLAECYREDGAYEDAIKYYTRAMELDPEHAKHHYLLGNGYFLLKRFRDALEHFRKARKLDVDERYKDDFAEQFISTLSECGLQEEAKAERSALTDEYSE